jgi:hypothetical protein
MLEQQCHQALTPVIHRLRKRSISGPIFFMRIHIRSGSEKYGNHILGLDHYGMTQWRPRKVVKRVQLRSDTWNLQRELQTFTPPKRTNLV